MKPGADFERVLVVGDPHLKVSRIDDAREFLDKLIEEAWQGQYSKVIILGDLFDTFAIIRSEILSLWLSALNKISERIGRDNLILIVGNHDYAGLKGGSHALEPFKPISKVVDGRSLIVIGGSHNIWFLPFIRDTAEFEERCRGIPKGGVLFCHQSFNGAHFENGFYDPGGADPSCVSHLAKVVSGHIHACQSVGENIWYPGTPFQQSFGEAGHRKMVAYMVVGVNKDGTSFAEFQKARELGMPEYVVLEYESVRHISLPAADPRTSYKIVAKGTPQEIAEFWSSDLAQVFRSGARRVVDALVPIVDVEDASDFLECPVEDRLEAFIKSRNWRVPQEVLIERARQALSG